MNTFLDQLEVLRPGWGDLVEILIVAALLYWFLLFIQRTRAFQMLLGVLLLSGIYFLAQFMDFVLIRQILKAVFEYGAIAVIVVFQPELRSALARIGQSRMLRIFNPLQESAMVDEIVSGVEQLSRSKVGAIVAIEGEVTLEEYAQTGSPVRAKVSADLLSTIFTPYSPLHDGAVIVRGDQIETAGAILPLTQSPLEDRSLGTRHRAALGLSEETDALVVVVSEETSRISVAHLGRMELDVDVRRLRERLSGALPDGGAVVSSPIRRSQAGKT